jgi:hypothetical protein
MKIMGICLIAAASINANALPSEPEEFQGLTLSEQATGCQLRFASNVDYLLARADAAADLATKQDITTRAFPAAGLALLAGMSAGKVANTPSDRVKKIGAYDPSSSQYHIGGYCLAIFWPTYLKYSKDALFRSEVTKFIDRKSYERYLAAGGIPKYAKEPILAGGVKGIPLGVLAAEAERQFLVAYPGASVACLQLQGISQAFHCQVAAASGAELIYANMPTSSLIYYIYENRVSGFGITYSAANSKNAFHVLEENLRSLIALKPNSDYQAGGPVNFLAWHKGQELLQLQTEDNEGTYLTYGVQSFLMLMMKASLPSAQSEKGM